ncbi:MAG: DUF6285 domain-containing protein [Kiloniellales bacterium]
MPDRPDGVALLELARGQLLEELLPELPEGKRLGARLVANAMAIAARELKAGDRPGRAELAALATLYGEAAGKDGPRDPVERVSEAIQRLSWRLASEIRGGKLDGNPEVYDLLRFGTESRLRLTNPKAVGEDDPEQG